MIIFGRFLSGINGAGNYIIILIFVVKYTNPNKLMLYTGILTSV